MAMPIAKSRVTLRRTTLKRNGTINCQLAEQSQQNTMWHLISCCLRTHNGHNICNVPCKPDCEWAGMKTTVADRCAVCRISRPNCTTSSGDVVMQQLC